MRIALTAGTAAPGSRGRPFELVFVLPEDAALSERVERPSLRVA